MPNDIDDLRTHLFETLAALKDKNTPMDLDRARAIAGVAKVLVESAKVEVDFLKVTGGMKSTGFLPEVEPAPAARRSLAPVPDVIDARDRAVLTFLHEGAATLQAIVASVAKPGKGDPAQGSDRDAVIVALGRLTERKQITRVGDTYVLADPVPDAARKLAR